MLTKTHCNRVATDAEGRKYIYQAEDEEIKNHKDDFAISGGIVYE